MRLRVWLLPSLLLGLAAIGAFAHPGGAWPQTVTSPLLLEFAAGIALAELHARHLLPSAFAAAIAFALGLCAFVGQAFQPPLPDSLRLLAWGVPAFLLVAGAVSLEQRGVMPVWAPVLALGDASYAIYLVHGLVISGLSRAHLPMALPGFVMICLFTSIIAGLLFARVIERPATNLLRRSPFIRWMRGGDLRSRNAHHAVEPG